MQCFLVGYRGTCHLSFVFSLIHTRLKTCVYTENISDAWHIPRYPTQNHCITSMYCIVYICCVNQTSLVENQFMSKIYHW